MLFCKAFNFESRNDSRFINDMERTGFMLRINNFAALQVLFLMAVLLGASVAPVMADPVDAPPVQNPTQFTTPPQTQPPVQADYQGAVQMNAVSSPVIAKVPQELLTMTSAEDPQGAKLSKQHKVVVITLKNTTAGHLEVLQAEVLNGVDEQVIAANKANQSNNARKAGSAFLRLGQAGMSFIPYAGVGMGGLYALNAANAASNVAQSALGSGGNSGAATTSGQYNKRLNNVFISPNESYQFKVIIPKKENAFFKVVFRDLTTNQILNYQI
jgi:hypothetical protein